MAALVELLSRWMTFWLTPSLTSIAVGTIVVLSLPILLHLVLFRPSRESALPSFLLVGLSDSGKTSLATYLERGERVATHTSQAPLTVEASLPRDIVAASSQYRSANDSALQLSQRLLLVDTPGHGKLRSVAFDYMADSDKLRGVIFVVDAADLSGSGQDGQLRGGLQDAAQFLHDVLLRLQKAATQQQASKKRQPRELPVLVAANKLDLFTALPTPLVKSRLEAEISKVRDSRRRALFDSSVGTGLEGPTEDDEEREMLGDPLEEKFSFSQMAELGVPVQVLGGHAAGPDGGDAKAWWKWIAEQM